MASDEQRIEKHMAKPAGGAAVPKSGSKLGQGASKCPRCQKSVFFNEKVVALGQEWHQACLKCTACQKRLDSTILTEHEGNPYCKGCYGAKFGPKGFGYVSTQHTEGGTGEKPINAAATGAPESPSDISAPSAATASGARFCSQCGQALSGAAKFCSSCGTKS